MDKIGRVLGRLGITGVGDNSYHYYPREETHQMSLFTNYVSLYCSYVLGYGKPGILSP